jgi:pSer/pThr/pTyr-binding forkhead associated (FHA) protein
MGQQSNAKGRITVTFMSGPLDGKTLEWDRPDGEREMVLTIGRREGCDIPLDYDTQVSRLHARIVYEPVSQGFSLEDAGSRNGTYLGSDRLTGRTSLQPGMLFRVGRTWLRIDPFRAAPQEPNADEE